MLRILIASALGLSIRIRMLAADVGLLMLSLLEVDGLVLLEKLSGKAVTSAVSTSTSLPSDLIIAATCGGCSNSLAR